MRVLGLTGSIGMGKTTTAAMFQARGIAVHDADQAVHRLYAGEGAAAIESAFPGVVSDRIVDRSLLAARILDDEQALARLERIVHPLVWADQAAFLAEQRARGTRLVLLDIPLLFETRSRAEFNAVLVVSAPNAVQRDRVMSRPGMTLARFETLLSRQLPDEEKRRRAHFVIATGRGLDFARRQVDAVLAALA